MIENKSLTGHHLKRIALITMLVDHIAAVVIWRIYSATFHITTSMQLSGNKRDVFLMWVAENRDIVNLIYDIMRHIGRLSFPIYCFLLVEGFLHTRSVKKYAIRLAVFALISEIPFDLAVAGEWWTLKYSNVFFTLVLGLLAIWAMSYIEKFYEFWQEKRWESILGTIISLSAGLIVVVGFGGFAEMVLCSDYGFAGVTAIIIMYLLRRQKNFAFAMGVFSIMILSNSSNIYALLVLFALKRYDGTRGKNIKYVFYAFYPVHLFILALICMALGV